MAIGAALAGALGDQGLQIGVGVDLLLDLAVFDQLLGELVGVHRAGGILVLQLGGEQRQEGVEIARQLLHRIGRWWCRWRWPAAVVRRGGGGDGGHGLCSLNVNVEAAIGRRAPVKALAGWRRCCVVRGWR